MRTPLHIAASHGKVEAVRYLVNEAGVNVNAIDRWGTTPLNDGADYQEIVQLLLQAGGKYGTSQLEYQVLILPDLSLEQYELFYAAFDGNIELLGSFINAGVSVNAQDYDGRTALGIASSEGHLNAVKFLIDKGADISLKNAWGQDPLDEAIQRGQKEIVEYLVKQSLVRNECLKFEEGLFGKGLVQTIGLFHKKFSDLRILSNQASSRNQFWSLLGNKKYSNQSASGADSVSSTRRIIEVFMSTQELYINQVIDSLTKVFSDTFASFTKGYKQVNQYPKLL